MPLNPMSLNDFIAENLHEFHDKRLASLACLKLEKILARKNPYLFRAKHIETGGMLVKQLLDAHLSSQEETIFGDFLETLAIHVCSQSFGGHKSAIEGIDLEFERNGERYIVSIKSGPNWANSSQIKKMRENFNKARRISKQRLIAVNGCCYGRCGKSNQGDYLKLCGQPFWALISGDETMYQRIIEPLGHRAKERNEAFDREYAKVINRFTAEFLKEFCRPDGAIDWEKLVAFNSAATQPASSRRLKGSTTANR